jgi:hypothetical protein
MDEGQQLVGALWTLFRDEISTGEPVFFCFSQETLKERLAAVGLGGEAPLSALCASARTCYDVDGHYVSLQPGALGPGSTGMSMAIVLVCQQVLAVEEMVREGSRYSENAYFPRLRSLMSPELPEWSLNPFRFDEFEAIWKKFAREIRSIEGSTDETITFEFGAYSGVNKARLFPLSQALLSRADLSELVRQCRIERLRGDSARDVWVEIRRERNHLSRRGQRLVNSGFLQERIVEQAQKYARRMSPSVSTDAGRSVRRPDQMDLAISLDVTDWFNEEYTAFLTVKGTYQRIEDDQRVSEKLGTLLAERGYVFCILAEFGDYWVFRDGSVEVGPCDTLLLVGTVAGIQRGQAVLDGLSPPVSIEESQVRSLGSAASVRVCPVSLPANLNCVVNIRAGRLLRGDSSVPVVSTYEWLGGMCLDGRSRKYLRQALPNGVRFGSEEFRMSQLNRVGDFAMSLEGFERALQKLDADAFYDIRFPNGRAARLSVGVEGQSVSEKMGFLVDSNGFLSPTLERIGESDSAVVGFLEPKSGLRRLVSPRAIANLIQDLTRRQGRQITQQEGQRIRRVVDASFAPDSVKRLVKELLARAATVRESTLLDLRVSP